MPHTGCEASQHVFQRNIFDNTESRAPLKGAGLCVSSHQHTITKLSPTCNSVLIFIQTASIEMSVTGITDIYVFMLFCVEI